MISREKILSNEYPRYDQIPDCEWTCVGIQRVYKKLSKMKTEHGCFCSPTHSILECLYEDGWGNRFWAPVPVFTEEVEVKNIKSLLEADLLKDIYPESTGNIEEDLHQEKLFLLIYSQFFIDIFPFWERTLKENISDEIVSSKNKNKVVNIFKKSKKINAKITREMLEKTYHFSGEWNSKQISTIVKRLNRLKKSTCQAVSK